MDRFTAKNGAVYAFREQPGCFGCAFDAEGECTRTDSAPCSPVFRADQRSGIWVRIGIDTVASDLAPREALLAHIADLTAERDEPQARERACPTMLEAEARALMRAVQAVAAHVGLGLEASPHQVVDAVGSMAARLAEIERQEPVAWVLRSTSGSARPTFVTRRSLLSCEQSDRADAGEDQLDPLYARPDPAAAPAQKAAVRAAVAAIYFADSSDYLGALWDVVRALRPDIAELLGRNERAAFEAVKDDVAPEQAEPDHLEDERRIFCRCGPDGCSDRVSCPKGGAA